MIIGGIEQAIDIAPGYFGYVNVVVHARVANQPPAVIKVILDTGFSGYLQMRPQQISDLGLQRIGTGRSTWANGATTPVARYLATIDWDGAQKEVVVQESEGLPLLGMSLLWGHLLMVKAEPGGSITLL
jgi:predicted aspartyl protease